MTDQWQEIYESARQWILEAGDILRKSLEGQLDVQFKSSSDDLVTNMDRKIEQFFISKIKAHYHDHRIISEEGYGDEVEHTDGVLWLIDPIDGTMNFVHQKRHFAISVGIFEEGVGRVGLIYDVVADDLYHCLSGNGAFINDKKLPMLQGTPIEESILAINTTWVNENKKIDPEIIRAVAAKARGTRSYGSAAIELAYIAAGTLDGYFTMRLSPWDYGAGIILIQEVGGVVTQVNGQSISIIQANSLFAGRASIHEEVIGHIKQQIVNGKKLND